MNPYDVLKISRDSDIAQVKEAYKRLSAQYYGMDDEFSKAKLKELDDAYDAIINHHSEFDRNTSDVMNEIRMNLKKGNLSAAEGLLLNVSPEKRNAEWYYLSGTLNKKRGYLEKAFNDFTTAHNMAPDNAEYNSAYENFKRTRESGYRTDSTLDNAGCFTCNLCQACLCADCLCHCCDCCR